jgi:carboxypeptidase T
MKAITRLLIAAVAFACLPLCIFAQHKFSKVRIHLPSAPGDRNNLLGLLEIDHFYPDGDAIIAEISDEGVAELRKRKVPFEILVDDVEREFARTSRPTDFYAADRDAASRMAYETGCVKVADMISTPAAFTAGSMGGYYTYAEMNTKMDNLVASYPSLVTKFSIGTTYQGRTLWCIKISDNSGTDESDEPEVLYTGLQHAREAISGTSLIFFMQYLAEKYATDGRIKDLVDNREIFIIPCMNPDGYEYNRQTNPSGGGLWRKNRRPNSGGSYGVDLNRNYSVDWGNCAGASSSCGSSSQSSDTYWGTSPFSEWETYSLKNFVTSRNFVIHVDQHCTGPYYSLPFGRPSLHTMSALDQQFYSYIPALMGKYNCHKAGNSPQTVGYEVAGGLKDWCLIGDIGTGTKGKIYSMTSEAGGGSFWAPTSSIIPLSRGLCFQNLQMAYAAGSYADLQDRTDVAVTTTSGTFSALLRRVGVSNGPVTITLEPVENIETVSGPVTINSLPNYYDTAGINISYTLPAYLALGERVRFVWKVETGGFTTYDTVTKFYNPLTLLADNMEGTFSTNWTATISPNASGGWAFTTLNKFEGARSMTESPNGNYTASSTRRVTYKNALNLSNATGAWLSFWVRHRSENCNDKLQVQVSTNGGVTYTAVCGRNTIAENDGTLAGKPALTGIRENWTRELVDLSAFKGFSNVRFRFEFTSNSDASGDSYYKKVDDGFYIDNLKVIKSTTALSARTATFVNLDGELLPDRSGLLTWEAFTDSRHDHFVVEKSVNGTDFTAIGVVKGFPPYQLTDPSIAVGSNIYRVKQINNDGTEVQSKTINLVSTMTALTMALYPNPTGDVLHIQLENALQQSAKIEIADAQGRIVHRQMIAARSGLQRLTVNTKHLKPQLYFLFVKDSKNQTITVQKFVKE